MTIATMAVCLSTLTSTANACNIPMFRYALERWSADECQSLIFHDGSLSADELGIVSALEAASGRNGGKANLRVRLIDVSQPPGDAEQLLWEKYGADSPALPHAVFTASVSRKDLVCWRGRLSEVPAEELLKSPTRREISRRLLSGHSAVWLVIQGTDKSATTTFVDQLSAQLDELAKGIPIPDGIGEPGSELLTDIPLVIRFSVLEVDPQDPKEKYLIDLVRQIAPEALEAGECVALPIFGRGRALEVVPQSKLDADLVEQICGLLCGACSCEIKALNPGFDLLSHCDWGDDPPPLAGISLPSLELDGTQPEPVMVAIPPGSSRVDNDRAWDSTDREALHAEDSHGDASDLHGGTSEERADASSDDDVADTETVPAMQPRQQSTLSESKMSVLIVLLVLVVVALVAAKKVDF